MTAVLAMFAVIIVSATIIGVWRPETLIELARSMLAAPKLWIVVLARIVLGLLLWFTASQSRTPLAFQVFSVLAMMAAIALPILGSTRILEWVDRYSLLPRSLLRMHCLVGMAFGVFLFWSIEPAM